MKTREPPPERDRDKGAGKEKSPLETFQLAASGVMQTSKERVLAAEKAERGKKKRKADDAV